MKRAKTKPEPKPITAQPPQDAEMFDVLAPLYRDSDGNLVTSHFSAPGCFRTPKRRTDK